MSNFFKFPSVENIIADSPKLSQILTNAEKYWAHRDKKGKKPPETLEEHLSLVLMKFQNLVQSHGLDEVIDVLIAEYLIIHIQLGEKQAIGSFIKKAFVDAIFYHDFGKVNENFQANAEKMNNPEFSETNSPISYFHSALGAYIYLIDYLLKAHKVVQGKDQMWLIRMVLSLSYSIFKHHGSRFKDEVKDKVSFRPEEALFMEKYLSLYGITASEQLTKGISGIIKNVFEQIDKQLNLSSNYFPLYSLVRLNFSLLTASDYLASGEYMSGLKVDDFGVLSQARKKEIFQTIQTSLPYNQTVYQELESAEIINPKDRSNDKLNILRKEMATEVIRNVRANTKKNLFYLEAPTGGGKTNLSMLATVELLQADARLNKVFYVFPFTTLITQTYQSINEILGLRPEEVMQLHSKTGISAKSQTEENKDGEYGDKRLNYIDHLFAHFPFCLLTHIRFFDIIKTNEKNTNYLLHRLANSVVVLDELQSYNPAHWDKLVYFIQQYAHFYNIKFILMSATLPKLDGLDLPDIAKNVFTPLLPGAKRKYFQNPNFAGRIEFDLQSLQSLPKNREEAMPILAERLIAESEAYAALEFTAKPKGSVYTIIEFIFKKSATEFYQVIEPLNHGFDEIFVLSGTILEHRRKEIINFLKSKENRKKKILLITTQVVEAGVDIDMDVGFKNVSLVDSDEQLAGRINRNVNKENCKLFLFKLDKPRVIYKNDYRFEAMENKQKFSTEDHLRILKEKDFDFLYKLVIDGIVDWENTEFTVGFSDYLDDLKRLNFQSVADKFKLIDQQTLSVFVPLNVPIEVVGKEEGKPDEIFSKSELKLLQEKGIDTCETVNGSAVFDLYIDQVHQKKGDFISKQIDLKTLQSIISKFVFSMFSSEKVKANFLPFSDIEKSEFGYLYLSDWEKVYDERFGIQESKFEQIENQFL